MAVIIKNNSKYFFNTLKFLVALFALLFFCSGDTPHINALFSEAKKHRQQNSLHNYINSLYDIIDAQPAYYTLKADSLLQTIWQTPTSLSEKEAYLNVLLLLGYHFSKDGQVPLSTRWYEAALNYYEQHKIPDTDWEELIAKPLGNNYTRLGDYNKALLLQQKAIQSAEENDNQPILPSLYGNYATTLFSTKNYTNAKQACNKGLLYLQKHVGIAGMLYNLNTYLYIETKQPDSAWYWNTKALAFFKNYKYEDADAAWHSTALLLSAKLYTAQHNYIKATKQLQQSRQLLNYYYPQSRQREKAKLAVETAAVFNQLNNKDSARYWYKQTFYFFSNNNQPLFPDNTFTDALFGMATSFEPLQSDSALYYYEKAILNDYYAQQLIGTSSSNVNELYANEFFTGKAIKLAYNMHIKTGNHKYALLQLWFTELSKGRQLLHEQQKSQRWASDSASVKQKTTFINLQYYYLQLATASNSIQKEKIIAQISEQEYILNLTEKNFERLLAIPSFTDFEKWLSNTSSNTDVVSYYQFTDTLYATYWSKAAIKSFNFSAKDSINNIPYFIKYYFDNGPTAYNNNPAAYYHQSHKLLKTVLPFFTTSTGQLIVSADAVLHQLPFEALCISDSSQFLAQSKSVSYSFSLLQFLCKPFKNSPLSINVFGFEKAYHQFAALPYVKEETDYLKNNFVHTYQSAQNTPSAVFLNNLQKNNVLHIATHAVANNNDKQPYLVLKENVYVSQLQYSTVQCPLVVLTACQTAAGRLQQKEGNISIGRAFISKGVQGVVANRWQADDKTASTLIILFYKALAQYPNPSMAMQKARNNYLQQCVSETEKNPWLWAGFCYQGVNQQIYLQQQLSFFRKTIVIISAAILLFMAFFIISIFVKKQR